MPELWVNLEGTSIPRGISKLCPLGHGALFLGVLQGGGACKPFPFAPLVDSPFRLSSLFPPAFTRLRVE